MSTLQINNQHKRKQTLPERMFATTGASQARSPITMGATQRFAAVMFVFVFFALGVYFLHPFTVDNSYADSTSNSYDTTVNIAPNLSISATDVSISDTPEASGSWLTGTSNVVVSTNNATGYKLYVSSSDSQVDLVNSDSSSAKISNLPAETTESTFRSDSSLMNHYGFTHDNNGSDPESGQITTGTYLPITDINNSRLIKATEEKQNISTTNVTFATKVDRSIPAGEYANTITFTAIANPVTNTLKQAAEKAGITTMQGLTQDVCAAADIYQSGEEDLTLTDTRDNSTYQIRKLADGNCWMVNNLKLSAETLSAAGHSTTLTSSDTDLPSGTTFTVPATSNTNWGGSSYAIAAKIANADPNSTGNGYGMYYNWWAAIASTNNPTTQYQNVTTSICPKGWDLPKGQGGSTASTNNDWYAMMVTGYGLHDSTSTGNPTSFTGTAYELPFSGNWSYSQTTPRNQGTSGNWWSSTVNNTNNAYGTSVNNNGGVSAGTNFPGKRHGYSVRCMLFPSA